jgi:hypothetical protein
VDQYQNIIDMLKDTLVTITRVLETEMSAHEKETLMAKRKNLRAQLLQLQVERAEKARAQLRQRK